MRIQYVTWLHPFTSAGIVCANVVTELSKMGIDVSIHPLNPDHDPVIPNLYSKEVQNALSKGFRDDVISIFFSYPDSYPHVRCRVNVGYTGADTSGWYQTNNQYRPEFFCNQFTDYMLTPSDYSRQIMYNCGVQKEIFLYPHGINFDIFKNIKRNLSYPFTFVYAGELTKRKGAQDVICAFRDLFGNSSEVQLLLRANTHMMYLESDEIKELVSKSNNIHVHWKNEGQEDFVSYLHAGNVFIYASRADWYGLPPMEALATGMPTIATATNGYYEFIKDMIIPVKTYVSDIGDQHPYFKGQWNEPDQFDLRSSIRNSISGNYEKHSEKAYENSFKLREDFSWKKVTEKYLLPFLEKVDKKHFPKPIKSAKIDFSDIKLYEKISK